MKKNKSALSLTANLTNTKIQIAQLLDNKLNEKYLLDEFSGKIILTQNETGEYEITADLSKINCEICFSQIDYFISISLLGLQQMKYLPQGNSQKKENMISQPINEDPSLPNIKLKANFPEFKFLVVDDKDSIQFPLFLFQIKNFIANALITGKEQNAQLDLEEIKLELKTKFKKYNKEQIALWKRNLYFCF